jgi:hypothetical protein
MTKIFPIICLFFSTAGRFLLEEEADQENLSFFCNKKSIVTSSLMVDRLDEFTIIPMKIEMISLIPLKIITNKISAILNQRFLL